MCRVPFFGLSDGNWHHVAVSVSAKRLALHVDCTRLHSADWEYRGMENCTAGLLMVGGIIEGHETPFEVHVKFGSSSVCHFAKCKVEGKDLC